MYVRDFDEVKKYGAIESHPATRQRREDVMCDSIPCLVATWLVVSAPAPAAECFFEEVQAHVREQFAQYGPLSSRREYFGFIYRLDGEIASAVARGNECNSRDRCTVNTAPAARAIPRGAKILGEWHTHPTNIGSPVLSPEDVRGAHNNRHITCYRPYYSTPGGDIYTWDANQTSMPAAMFSRLRIGSLHEQVARAGADSDLKVRADEAHVRAGVPPQASRLIR